MKKIMFAAVSALALSAMADGVDSTQFGAMAVAMTTPTKRTLVAIPWCEASTAGTAVAVSNLVLTANLTTNDTIVVLRSDGNLDTWTLKENNETKVKYWEAPVNTIIENVGLSSGTDSDKATVNMGDAVVLNRQKIVYAEGDTLPEGKSVGDAIPFYVMGQVASTAPSTTIVAPTGTQSATNVCYNMIAPPTVTNQYLNGSGDHCAKWTTDKINEDDRICIPTPYLNLELKYVEDTGWCQLTTVTTTKYYKYEQDEKTKEWSMEEVTEEEVKAGQEYDEKAVETSEGWVVYTAAIPVGTGFWYVSAGGTPTVTWDSKDIPTK